MGTRRFVCDLRFGWQRWHEVTTRSIFWSSTSMREFWKCLQSVGEGANIISAIKSSWICLCHPQKFSWKYPKTAPCYWKKETPPRYVLYFHSLFASKKSGIQEKFHVDQHEREQQLKLAGLACFGALANGCGSEGIKPNKPNQPAKLNN